MPQPTDQDRADFVDAMNTVHPLMGAYAKECMDKGQDPRSMAAAYQCAADNAKGWCDGRFGPST